MHFIAGLCIFSACLSAWLVGLVRQYFRKQLIDIPNERSSHKVPTPRGGGLGFIFASLLGLVLYTVLPDRSLPPLPVTLWLSLLPLIGIGLLDDWKDLGAGTRYTIQLLVSSLLVMQLGAFPQPWLTMLGQTGSIVAVAITVIGITALINFYNFMDGLDGLLGSVSLVQLSFLAMIFDQPSLWILVGALGGFLFWNWSPAKIFMGDVGSTVLGAVVATSLLSFANSAVASDWVFSWSSLTIVFPLVGDAFYTLICRTLRKENIFKAHRVHLYQRLSQAGWTHAQVAILYACSTVLVATSFFLWGNVGALLSCFVGCCGIFCLELLIQRAQSSMSSLSEPASSPAFAKPGQ